MTWIEGGTFLMGSADFYPEERPVRAVSVDGFWIEEHPVTAGQFRRFVRETGYVTVAERPLDPSSYPGVPPDRLVPGSLVFHSTSGPVDLDDVGNWWEYVPGAFWKRPEGRGSTVNGRDRHPVVHIAYEDALAYAAWVGRELPTESEWEVAARGRLDGAVFAWGDEELPDGRVMANTWQGEFPWQNLRLDGFDRTSPVGSFPANGYGLFDMTGNVWEWTVDAYEEPRAAEAAATCCAPGGARGTGGTTTGQLASEVVILRKAIKGGSHLCAPNYCLRYRPAARQGQDVDTSTSHLGFRCVLRAPGPEHADAV